MDKKNAANIVKPMQTRIYRKKCVNGSKNSKGHQRNIKKNRRDAYYGLDLSTYVIKSPIQLVRLYMCRDSSGIFSPNRDDF